MSSLRNLLGSDHKSDLNVYGQVPSPLFDGKVVTFTYDKDCCCYSCGWESQRRHMWCAPCGVCRITFEAWGGAGGAASACCCTVSTPGTLGAYVRKTICGSLGGSCFCICLGRVEGSDNQITSKRGCRGCWTTICGPDVFLCAEGGYGGCAICNLVQPAGTGNNYFGESRIVLFDNTSQPDNCVEFGPPGYGGDINMCGHTGFFRYHCACNKAVYQHIPSPPYIGHTGARAYVTFKHCTDQTCTYAHMRNSASSFTGATGGFTVWANHERGWRGSPMPYPGPNTTGSCCVHGTPSGAGMVRITYQGCRCGCYCADLGICTGMANCSFARHMCS